MRILLFTGNHSRHFFVHRELLKSFEVCGVVCMERESTMPEPPSRIPEIDARNFRRHFKDRQEAELRYFGEVGKEVLSGVPTHYCSSDTLNSNDTRDFIIAQKPDIVFIFGVEIIKEPVMSVLPHDRLNMHLGLSPWYRGGATLFWPFYNLEPQFCGATFHQIVPATDAGNIIHQTVPVLERGDGIHDVAVKTVVACMRDAERLLTLRKERGMFNEVPQKGSGRLYLNSAFKPEHLRVIYNLFDNNIVDAYLDEELSQHKPSLISAF